MNNNRNRKPFPLPAALEKEAENLLEALYKAATDKGVRLPKDDHAVSGILQVFALSPFVAKSCVKNPDMLAGLIESGDLDRPCDADNYDQKTAHATQTASDEAGLMSALRSLRNREMIRIAWRDLSGRADLFSTISELSAFASSVLSRAHAFIYDCLCREFGTPISDKKEAQQLVITGLGKLGGGELNFSSDIDIMFAFPETGTTSGGGTQISNTDFFLRLARKLINVIGKPSADGLVFRVDTRLRPYGESGPLVMSFDAMESYYQSSGREWERYALIKARPVAGDISAGNRLLNLLTPFVFRRYIDYGTFDALREMKDMIYREVARKGLKNNIKHGAGGIREIEFFGQVFQLLRGGVDRRYRVPGIMQVVDILREDALITEDVHKDLTDAYIFLRNTEHSIQMAADIQTHTLPSGEKERLRLATGMGYESWPDFYSNLSFHMQRVHAHFNDLLADDSGSVTNEESGIEGIWLDSGERDERLKILADEGFENPEEVLDIIDDFKHRIFLRTREAISLQRTDKLMPRLIACTAVSKTPETVLKKLLPLVESIVRRSCYISLLLENPGVLPQLVRLADLSPWIITFLASHPLLLDELIDPRGIDESLDKPRLAAELKERLASVSDDGVESQMDAMRVFKQLNLFRIAIEDVTERLPLMKVSDKLTFLAEAIVEQVVNMAWRHMAKRYGKPSTADSADDGIPGFAVIAYGKLGGLELGYGSDLDLVFLHAAAIGMTRGGDMPAIGTAEFYTRLGQRIIHYLSAATSAGRLYEVDMRLRPSGNAGLLVSGINAFETYQHKNAWAWEHQAIIKARPICGDPQVTGRFNDIRRGVMGILRNHVPLRLQVSEMREKMRQSKDNDDVYGFFDIKQDPGGIIDIEFIVQYLILANAEKYDMLTNWTDVVRQLNTLSLCGVIDDLTAHALKQAYLVYRHYIHRLNLQEKPAKTPENRFTELRARVRRIWNVHMCGNG
ncbi:MAG: bifunctional [glutamate--ammonia ligase]-adenylyl-L-tyrosine phosphorylase/[glutamate--ammonia-ligase] adenylyltransferase [Deltaproteobacteria bacterium]|nr:bifunctional [glutamate--ammonia ligase]-adenylyl-L-tyrosine phosphorylase/[glutamate--ammonia-ligase] adenylyltransferase [Deltaproteobacteria bacterium]